MKKLGGELAEFGKKTQHRLLSSSPTMWAEKTKMVEHQLMTGCFSYFVHVTLYVSRKLSN